MASKCCIACEFYSGSVPRDLRTGHRKDFADGVVCRIRIIFGIANAGDPLKMEKCCGECSGLAMWSLWTCTERFESAVCS